MKKLLPLLFIFACHANTSSLFAQCSGGQTKCFINWDYLKFFPSAGIGAYTNLATSQTQSFAIGTQKLTITHNFTGSNAVGEDVLNTAEASAFGTGADVHFIGDGIITVTFQAAVDSIRFSLFDIDLKQRVIINSPGLLAKVTLSTPTAGILSFPTNNSPSAQANAANTVAANTDDRGTLNVLITNSTPLTTFTITVTNTTISPGVENGDFWLSDISACVGGTFNSNYFQISKPFTNQPGYIVTSRNDSFYFVNPVNGAAKFIFKDNSGLYANSVGYDPVRHEIYYAFSLTSPGPAINPNNKTLRRYNYDKDTFGVVIPDVTVFCPVFEQGIESGAAAFYDGSLYLGIEASSSGPNESIVWKIDFNASGNPTAASQVYSAPGAGRDWGDIAVVNGTLIDFDSRPASPNYFHQNLYTKAVTTYNPAAVDAPRQAAVNWNNVVYNIGGSANSFVVGGVTIATGTIATYNGNGTINAASIDTIKFNGVAEMGSWGDAGEAFKPRVDYGDAPATYDPAGSDPAVHEISANLRLGVNSDNEWVSRGQSIFANSDNYDDGLVSSSLVNPSAGTFFAQVNYYNNSGATATLIAWVDFNNNGKFDAAEGLSKTNLPSSASMQTAFFNWTGVATTLVDGSYTYLRFRITSTANGMTTANATGFYDNGEVEDYRLVVTTNPLATQLVKFDALKQKGGKIAIDWQVTNEEDGLSYNVQRSVDGSTWHDIKSISVVKDKVINSYSYIDATPLNLTSYYRLQLTKNVSSYSTVKKISAASFSTQVVPNPASDEVRVVINSTSKRTLQIILTDAGGRRAQTLSFDVNAGVNRIPLQLSSFADGVYWIQISTGDEMQTERLLIKK